MPLAKTLKGIICLVIEQSIVYQIKKRIMCQNSKIQVAIDVNTIIVTSNSNTAEII